MAVFSPMLQHDEKEWSGGQPEPYEYHSRTKSIVLWGIVFLLAAALAGLVYYGFRTSKIQDVRLTEIFGRQGAVNSLGQRADAAESKLHDLAGNWQSMGERVTTLESTFTTGIKGARSYAETLTRQLHQQVTSEMDSRTSALDARIGQLEAQQAEQREHTAQVDAALKKDMQDMAGITTAQEENGRDLSSVRQREEMNARGVNALSQRLDRRRVDFEVVKGQTKELIPGVWLQIRGVNQGHQSYRGSLELSQNQPTVRLRDQNAQEPVRFFTANSGDPYELVVMRVTKKDVAGYLLAPIHSEGQIGSGSVAGGSDFSVTR